MTKDVDISEIYKTHYARIVQYLKRMVGEAEAEDLAQEVFLKVNAGLAGFRGESRLATWIYRIATNRALDHIRSGSTRGTVSPVQGTDEEDDGTAALSDDSAPPDMLLIRKDMNECILGIVNRLPDNYRTVLVLRDLEGLTNAEIADVLGISLDTVKIRLHRARARLKKEMEAQCHLYRDDRNELACDRKTAPLKFLKK